MEVNKEEEDLDYKNKEIKWNDMFTYRWDEQSNKWMNVSFRLEVNDGEGQHTEVPEVSFEGGLKVLTYNVLFDKYDKEEIRSSERFPHINELLKGSNADVIVLEEVTVPFAKQMLRQEWVREKYWSTDSPHCLTLAPYGQLVLSRHPCTTRYCRLSQMKMAVVCGYKKKGGGRLGVAGVHLTSNYKDGDGNSVTQASQDKRQWQLEVIAKELEECEEGVIAGDFNYDAEEDLEGGEEFLKGYGDCWTMGGGQTGVRGYTFDAVLNPTASITSRSNKRKRYDRVLYRGKMECSACCRLGTVACVEGEGERQRLCPSDHYAVMVELGGSKQERGAKHYDTVEQLLSEQSKSLGLVTEEVDKRRKLAGALEGRMPEGTETKVVGSVRLGCAFRDSDLDLVCLGTLEEEAWLCEVAKEVGGLIVRGKVSVVRCTMEGVTVELAYARRQDKKSFVRQTLKDMKALEAVFDKHSQAALALSFLKLWAVRAGVYGGQYGYLNGLALAVMVAALAPLHSSPELLVRAFFAEYGAPHRLERVCHMNSNNEEHNDDNNNNVQLRKHDHLPICSPSGLVIIRNSTKSSAFCVREALEEGRRLCEGEEWLTGLLLQGREGKGVPRMWSSEGDYLRVVGSAEEGVEAFASLVASKAIALVLSLEQAGQCVRLWPQLLSAKDQHTSFASSFALVLCLLPSSAPLSPSLLRSLCGQWEALVLEASPSSKCSLLCHPLHSLASVPHKRFVPPPPVAPVAPEEALSPEQLTLSFMGKHAEHVYDRVKWDPAFSSQDFEIGWEDRFLGIVRKNITAFKPGGAVPYHRVKCFWYKGHLIWQRGQKE